MEEKIVMDREEDDLSELEKLGFKVLSNDGKYWEWVNLKADVRLSWLPDAKSFYIRQASVRRPIAVPVGVLMAFLIDAGIGELR